MNRRINAGILLKLVSNARYLPAIVINIRNWRSFLVSYITLVGKDIIYTFRKDGTKLKTRENFDTATIAVIYFKKDYGIIPDNSTIVDIGANIGVFSVYAATTAKNSTIFAYEPMKDSYELLQENIAINKFGERILAFNLGISAKTETRKLFLYKTALTQSIY